MAGSVEERAELNTGHRETPRRRLRPQDQRLRMFSCHCQASFPSKGEGVWGPQVPATDVPVGRSSWRSPHSGLPHSRPRLHSSDRPTWPPSGSRNPAPGPSQALSGARISQALLWSSPLSSSPASLSFSLQSPGVGGGRGGKRGAGIQTPSRECWLGTGTTERRGGGCAAEGPGGSRRDRWPGGFLVWMEAITQGGGTALPCSTPRVQDGAPSSRRAPAPSFPTPPALRAPHFVERGSGAHTLVAAVGFAQAFLQGPDGSAAGSDHGDPHPWPQDPRGAGCLRTASRAASAGTPLDKRSESLEEASGVSAGLPQASGQ